MGVATCRGRCGQYDRISTVFGGPLSTHPDVIVVTSESDPGDSKTWEYDPNEAQRLRAAKNFKDIIELCPGPDSGGNCGVYPKAKCDDRSPLPLGSIYVNIDVESEKNG